MSGKTLLSTTRLDKVIVNVYTAQSTDMGNKRFRGKVCIYSPPTHSRCIFDIATSNVVFNCTRVLFNGEAFYCFKNNSTLFMREYSATGVGFMLVVVFLPFVGGVIFDVDGCGVLPDDFAVFIVVSASTSSLLFIAPVVAFNVPSDASMAVAAELFGRQRIPGPAFGVAC
jgi:hypothetical protein